MCVACRNGLAGCRYGGRDEELSFERARGAVSGDGRRRRRQRAGAGPGAIRFCVGVGDGNKGFEGEDVWRGPSRDFTQWARRLQAIHAWSSNVQDGRTTGRPSCRRRRRKSSEEEEKEKSVARKRKQNKTDILID